MRSGPPRTVHTSMHTYCRRIKNRRHRDRKSTRLNSSHTVISYAVFCLKKKKNNSVLKSRQEAERRRLRASVTYAVAGPIGVAAGGGDVRVRAASHGMRLQASGPRPGSG